MRLAQALLIKERGEPVFCELWRAPQSAPFHCLACDEPRCARCVMNGACVECGAVVRSYGSLLLDKEKP